MDAEKIFTLILLVVIGGPVGFLIWWVLERNRETD